METWKKVLLRAFGYGAGFTITAAIVVGLFAWWSGRPKRPKPWDTHSITASFDGVTTEGDDNAFVFVYTLQDNTDFDYQVDSDSTIHLAALLKETNALTYDSSVLKVDYPIFVPAHNRIRFRIHLHFYKYSSKDPSSASGDARRDWETLACKYLSTKTPNLNGFVMLDEARRYQINFPNGWNDRAKESLHATTSADAHAP